MELTELLTLLRHESRLYLTWGFVLYYGTVLFLVWQVYKLVIRPLFHPLLKQLPHKPFRPIVGNFMEIAREEAITPYNRWIEELQSSLIVYHGMLGSVRIMVADPDFMKHVLVTNSRNYPKPKLLFGRLSQIIGNGLIISEGHVHATHRKLCNGSFRLNILQKFVPIFEKYAIQMCEQWVQKVEGNTTDDFTVISPTESFTSMSLDAIGECGFDYKFNSLTSPEASDVVAFQRILGLFGFSWKLLIPYYSKLPTAEKRRWDSDMKIINTCVATVIAAKKKLLSSIKDDDHVSDLLTSLLLARDEATNEGLTEEEIRDHVLTFMVAGHEVSDLLTSLLLARDEATNEGLTEEEIRDHVLTFMVAGHETSSSALLWCLLCLSKEPEMQEKLRVEVCTIEGPLTWEKVEQLPYLNAVVKETLRLYPPVSLTFREAAATDHYKDLVIPKGTVVNLAIGALQRNAKYWDDPLKFMPERFLTEAGTTPYTFLPFIAGPRMCIGYKFALMEMKVTIATLLRQLKFQPIPDQKYRQKQRITMRPEPKLELRVSKADV